MQKVIAASVCAVAVFSAGALANGWRWAEKYSALELSQARIEKSVSDAAEESRKAVALEIAKIKITNTTINRKVEREVQEHTVYASCRVPDSGMHIANEALSGKLSIRPELPSGIATTD